MTCYALFWFMGTSKNSFLLQPAAIAASDVGLEKSSSKVFSTPLPAIFRVRLGRDDFARFRLKSNF